MSSSGTGFRNSSFEPIHSSTDRIRVKIGSKVRSTRVYESFSKGVFTTYGIIDPRTGYFVYVGQTSNFDKRKSAHLRPFVDDRKRPGINGVNIRTWMYDALKAGVAPVIVVLETVNTWQESLKSEFEWVYRLASENHPLLNKWVEHKEAIKIAIAAKSKRNGTLNAVMSRPLLVREPIMSRILPDNGSARKTRRALRGNKGLSWTATHDAELLAHYNTGVGAIGIAIKVQRTPAAVRARLVRLGAIAKRKDLRN